MKCIFLPFIFSFYKYTHVYLAVLRSEERLEKGFLLGICLQQKGAGNVLGANGKRTKYMLLHHVTLTFDLG